MAMGLQLRRGGGRARTPPRGPGPRRRATPRAQGAPGRARRGPRRRRGLPCPKQLGCHGRSSSPRHGRGRVGAHRGRAGTRRGRWGEIEGLRREERRNEELGFKSWRRLTGEEDLAGAEEKSVDCRRFGDPIDEPNALRRSPRQDERSVPSDSADDARIGSNCSLELSPELEPPRTSASNTGS
jgi:hypothetical protein